MLALSNLYSKTSIEAKNNYKIQWNPSKPELLKTGNPSKLNDFVSPEFLSSYLIYPSKPKTPINQTFSLVRRVFGLVGLHCIIYYYCLTQIKNNGQILEYETVLSGVKWIHLTHFGK